MVVCLCFLRKAGDVTFIGTGDRAEIWSTECWTQFNDNLTEDSIAEAMDALSF